MSPFLHLLGENCKIYLIYRFLSNLFYHLQLDSNSYEKGKKISKEELENLNLKRHEFHGEWNYTIAPNITVNVI